MNNKAKGILMAYALMAVQNDVLFGNRGEEVRPEIHYIGKPKKCLRPECDKNRSGNKLYCSAACNKLDKARRKSLK